MNCNPNLIVELSRKNRIVANLFHLWLRGDIDWEFMLHKILKQLDSRCVEMIQQYNKLTPEDSKLDDRLPFKPDLFDIKDPIVRQQKLIGAIALISEYYEELVRITKVNTFLSAPVLVVKNPSSNTYVVLDPRQESGD